MTVELCKIDFESVQVLPKMYIDQNDNDERRTRARLKNKKAQSTRLGSRGHKPLITSKNLSLGMAGLHIQLQVSTR